MNLTDFRKPKVGAREIAPWSRARAALLRDQSLGLPSHMGLTAVYSYLQLQEYDILVFLGCLLSHVYRAMLQTHTLLHIIENDRNKINKIKISCMDMWEGSFLN